MEPATTELRMVNVHQAKTQLSRLIDDAHAGETIVLAKAGKPWARLMPLEHPAPQRLPGRQRSLGPLSHPDALLEPLEPEELAAWEEGHLLPVSTQPRRARLHTCSTAMRCCGGGLIPSGCRPRFMPCSWTPATRSW
jgi:antitoxin (DNA-binding transcriptional repressor) of toxin-antitoxin stability system